MKRELVSLLFIALFFLTTSLQAQNPTVVYVRVIESVTAITENFMQVSGNDGSNKRTELEKLKIKGDGAAGNGVKISNQIKELLDQGYEMKSHSTGGSDIFITTMVFIKTEKED